MFVIRLPNGNLLVPESAMSGGNGGMMGDAYVEIGPGDADYDRLEPEALTQEEVDERRRRWQEGDEPLRREFLDYLASPAGPLISGGPTTLPRATAVAGQEVKELAPQRLVALLPAAAAFVGFLLGQRLGREPGVVGVPGADLNVGVT